MSDVRVGDRVRKWNHVGVVGEVADVRIDFDSDGNEFGRDLGDRNTPHALGGSWVDPGMFRIDFGVPMKDGLDHYWCMPGLSECEVMPE